MVTDVGWLGATALAGVALLFELVALRNLPLVVVMPIVAAGVAVLAPISRSVLGERTPRRWLVAVVVLVAGVAMLAVGAPENSAEPDVTVTASVLLAGATLVLALACYRWLRSGAWLALAAGAAYGVSGIFSRLLATAPHPTSTLALAALAGLGIAGGAGLLLEMQALERSSPTIVGPVVLVLTAVLPILVEAIWFSVPLAHPAQAVLGCALTLGGVAWIASMQVVHPEPL